MLTLTNWYVISLAKDVVIGVLPNGYTISTDPILGIKDNYLVTENEIFKLAEPDKIWINTSEAKILNDLKF